MTDYRNIWKTDYATTQQERTEPPGSRERKRFRQVYEHYLRGWLPQDRTIPILDVGCGAGLFLHFLKDEGYTQLSGVDASPSQVALARQSGLEILQENALDHLKQRSGDLGLIVALDFIEHLTRDEALTFLDACFQALQPGGRLILQTPNGESPWVGNVLYGDYTHEQCFTPHLLEKLMHRAGFEQIQPRACGPAPVDAVSRIRSWMWCGITLGCRLLNLIEGAVSSGLYTRVFLISAVRSQQPRTS